MGERYSVSGTKYGYSFAEMQRLGKQQEDRNKYRNMSDADFNKEMRGRNRMDIANGQQASYGGYSTNSDGTGDNKYGGDWTSGNSNFSFDNLKNQAKELAQQQLDISRQQMQTSYDFREKEKASNFGYDTQSKNQDAEIRSRENNQKFGFEEALQKMQNQQQLTMQSNQYNQERSMFDRQDAAKNAQVDSARSAANNLYFRNRRRR